MDKSLSKGYQAWVSEILCLFFFIKGNLVFNTFVKCNQRREIERMSTRARSPEVDGLSCVPGTQQRQQATGVEELVVGVVDPVELLDTEQGDTGLETQHDSDTSDEDTQAATGTQTGKCKGKAKADKRSKKPQFYSPLSRNRR